MNGQITLNTWREKTFAEACRPHINTVRRWVAKKLIQPEPVKHGREYYCEPYARYTDKQTQKPRVLDRIRASETTQS